jgi:hypothetical protein
LVSYEVLLPDADALQAVLERVKIVGLQPTPQDGGWLARDPSQNGILLRTI